MKIICKAAAYSPFGSRHLIAWLLLSGVSCLASNESVIARAGGDNVAVSETEGLAETAELADYLTYAALHNPGLRAAFERWQAALAMVPQAEAMPDPTFAYTWYIREIETRVGPQEQKLDLMQKFPWFGKRRLRGEVAGSEALAARHLYDARKLELFYRVKVAYYDYFYLHRAIAVTRRNLELLTHLEEVARARYRAGAPLPAVVQAQVELGKLHDRLRSLEELRGAQAARLNAILNRPVGEPLPWPQTLPESTQALGPEQARRLLRKNNPELARLAALAVRQEQAGALAAKDRWPDVSLGVSMIDTGEALMPGTPGSGTDAIMATVAVNLPIWRSSYAAKEDEARRRQQAFLAERQDTTNLLEAELSMILYQIADAERKIDLYRDTLVPKGEQSLKVAQQAFEAGQVDFLSLIDAERLLLEFELAHEQARVELARRLAELEKITGMLPSTGSEYSSGNNNERQGEMEP